MLYLPCVITETLPYDLQRGYSGLFREYVVKISDPGSKVTIGVQYLFLYFKAVFKVTDPWAFLTLLGTLDMKNY